MRHPCQQLLPMRLLPSILVAQPDPVQRQQHDRHYAQCQVQVRRERIVRRVLLRVEPRAHDPPRVGQDEAEGERRRAPRVAGRVVRDRDQHRRRGGVDACDEEAEGRVLLPEAAVCRLEEREADDGQEGGGDARQRALLVVVCEPGREQADEEGDDEGRDGEELCFGVVEAERLHDGGREVREAVEADAAAELGDADEPGVHVRESGEHLSP